ncbi:MAG: UMP kinase [Defluviitaleaceae bacterium]|nr:UMP kinase [Defluviitaleaceae bacterium]MCL2274354.1 UMP kinase [Defluviitaleaceae bacterium]
MFKRTVIKLSGEAIGCSESPSGYNDEVINNILRQIRHVMQAGTEVALVVGGGNLWRGRSASPEMDRVKADNIGMLATVMNALYLADMCRRQDMKAQVVTPITIGRLTTVYEKERVLDMMAEKTVVINAAGVGHPFFSTDTVTALRAAELEADCVLYAKNIDGVYTCDPLKNKKACKYRNLSYATAIKQSLGAADMAALHLSAEAEIPSYVFSLNKPDSIVLACGYPNSGSLEGTYISFNEEEDFYAGRWSETPREQ